MKYNDDNDTNRFLKFLEEVALMLITVAIMLIAVKGVVMLFKFLFL